jgi:hypothetical protein
VRVWRIKFDDRNLSMEVQIEAREDGDPGNWHLITINMTDCLSLQYNRSNTEYFDVLSNGLGIVFEENVVGFDFGYYTNPAESIDQIRKSPCHVISREAKWIINEIQ